jgi:hypothetical protein
VKKVSFDTVAHQLTSVSPEVLQRLANHLESERKLSNLSTEEQGALKLLQQVNTLLAHIPGSQAAKILCATRLGTTMCYELGWVLTTKTQKRVIKS